MHVIRYGHPHPRGRILELVVGELGFSVLNKNSPTHLRVYTGSLFMNDFMIGTPDTLLEFRWSLDSDLRESDHFPT